MEKKTKLIRSYLVSMADKLVAVELSKDEGEDNAGAGCCSVALPRDMNHEAADEAKWRGEKEKNEKVEGAGADEADGARAGGVRAEGEPVKVDGVGEYWKLSRRSRAAFIRATEFAGERGRDPPLGTIEQDRERGRLALAGRAGWLVGHTCISSSPSPSQLSAELSTHSP